MIFLPINSDLTLDGMHTLTTGIRYGRISGIIVVELTNISVAGPNTVIGTLPAGYRPLVIGYAKIGGDNYGATNVFAYVQTNGNIVITGIYQATSSIYGTIFCV